MRPGALAIAAVCLALPACSGSSGETAAAAVAKGPGGAEPGADPGATGAGASFGPAAVARHAVFSLADNRLLAHVQVGGGLRVVAGSGGFAKYVGLSLAGPSSWSLGQKRGEARVAVPRGTGTIHVPLGAEQAAATEIAVRLNSRADNQLTVRVNGAAAGAPAAVGAGWQIARVAVPAGKLKAGENKIELQLAKPDTAIEWLQIGGAATPDDRVPAFAAPATLTLPRDGGLAWYVHVPQAAQLEADVGGAGCSIEVTAAAAEGAPVKGTLAGAGAKVDLAPLAGKAARLELTARGCDLAQLEGAALTGPGPAPSVPAAAPPPKYVVLWVMDTLRADRVKPFDPNARAEVPAWERLAKRGAVFVTSYSQGNESQAAHGSIWTGSYPVKHRIAQDDGAKLDPAGPHLGRELKAAGFRVLGVTANGFVTAGANYHLGFEKYLNLMRGPDAVQYDGRVPSETLYGRALELLKGRERDPWFLFIGSVDTHKPWIGHEPWLSKYDPAPYDGKFKTQASAPMLGMVHMTRACIDVPSERDFQRILAIYDTDVSYQDKWVGTLLDQLEAWGIADQTMVIITADHGEELWEHGRCGHGYSMRDMLVRVPFLVSYPPLIPAGAVLEGAETMDILPTVLDALGRPIPDSVQGDSLIPYANGVGRGYPRSIMSTTTKGAGVAMRIDRWKLRVARTKSILNDVVADPAEKTDLGPADRPIEYRFVADPMALFLTHQTKWSKRRWGPASNMKPAAATDLDW